jgi:photosystem II stability/assembly factor-like uncharacterized protein
MPSRARVKRGAISSVGAAVAVSALVVALAGAPLASAGAASAGSAVAKPWVFQSAPLPPAIDFTDTITCGSPSLCISLGQETVGDVLLTTTDAGTKWSLRQPPTDIGAFVDLSCSGEDCLATIGPHAFGATQPSGAASSTDGGRRWTLDKTIPGSGNGFWSTADCPTVSTCYVLDEGSGAYTAGGIEKTANLGAAFRSEHLSGPGAAGVSDLLGMSCADAASCAALGERSAGGSDVVWTANGGADWAVGHLPAGPSVSLDAISCVTASTECVAVGTEGTQGTTTVSYTSANGGRSWAAAGSLGFSGSAAGVACMSSSSCVAVGYEGDGLTDEGVVATSADFGKSWRATAGAAGSGALFAVACPSATECIADRSPKVLSPPGPAGGTGWLVTDDGGAKWAAADVPLGIAELSDVSCVTRSECTAVGGTAGPKDEGVIVATADGGSKWVVSAYVPGLQSLTNVSCPSAAVCVAVGTFNWGTGHLIAYTDDGGSHWATVRPPAGVTSLLRVSCPTPTVCEVLGRRSSGKTLLLRTTDGGSTWSESEAPSGLAYGLDLTCPSAEDCYLVGDRSQGGAIFATTDGGEEWVRLPVPSADSIVESISCPTVKVCYALSGTDVAVTTDGGSHFTNEALPPALSFPPETISCAGASSCAGVTMGPGPVSPSVAFATTTAGESWYNPVLPADVGFLLGISCVSAVCTSVGVDGEIVRGGLA